MKQIFWVTTLVMLAMVRVNAQVRWDGEGGDNLWTNAANWSANTVPAASDDVLLDNSIVTLSYLVSLAPGNSSVTVNSLHVSPSAAMNITLLVPATNTSATAFMATAAGDAIVLDNGALLINSSKAPSGTPVSVGTANFFRINNGGKYIHNTDNGHTNNLVARLSTAPGTEDGIFEFDVPGNGAYTISASNRTYGHLIFSAAASGINKVYTAAGISPFTINGDLEIQQGATLSYGATTNNLIVNKNCMVAAGAVFNISNSMNSATVILRGNLDNKGTITESGSSTGSRIEWNGNAIQQLKSTGIFTQTITMTINNPSGLLLLTPWTLPYKLQLLSGNIKTGITNLLTMLDNGTYSGGGSLSMVEGPMRKIGDDDFDFPIGIGTIYAPIGIAGGTGATTNDAFVAEYVRSNPQAVHGAVIDPFFNHISYVEYWTLNREVGDASKQVKLTAQQYSFARVFNTTYSTRYDGVQWNNLGRNDAMPGPVFPPNETGTIKTNETNAFGDFTLATTDNVGVNPLPVRLLSFEVEKISATINKIDWQFLDMKDEVLVEIERANDDQIFKSIASISVDHGAPVYSYTDRLANAAVQFYRLKIKYPDASIGYSSILKLDKIISNVFFVALMTNPINGNSGMVQVHCPQAGRFNWIVSDMNGHVVDRKIETLPAGLGTISLNIGALRPGYYILMVLSLDRKEFRSSVKFMKF